MLQHTRDFICILHVGYCLLSSGMLPMSNKIEARVVYFFFFHQSSVITEQVLLLLEVSLLRAAMAGFNLCVQIDCCWFGLHATWLFEISFML